MDCAAERGPTISGRRLADRRLVPGICGIIGRPVAIGLPGFTHPADPRPGGGGSPLLRKREAVVRAFGLERQLNSCAESTVGRGAAVGDANASRRSEDSFRFGRGSAFPVSAMLSWPPGGENGRPWVPRGGRAVGLDLSVRLTPPALEARRPTGRASAASLSRLPPPSAPRSAPRRCQFPQLALGAPLRSLRGGSPWGIKSSVPILAYAGRRGRAVPKTYP